VLIGQSYNRYPNQLFYPLYTEINQSLSGLLPLDELLLQQLVQLLLRELGLLAGRAGGHGLRRAELGSLLLRLLLDKLLLLLRNKLLLLLLGSKSLLLRLWGTHKLLLALKKLLGLLLQSSKRLLLLLRSKLLLLLLTGGKLLLLLLLRHKLLLTGSKLLLLRSKLLLLGSKLLLLGSKVLLGSQVGGERINLTILIVVPGETFKSNLLSSELTNGNWSHRLGSKLLLLLRLESGSRLSALLLGKLKLLLLLGSKLLLLGSKLLLLLGSKLLLLLLGSKLLLLLGSELLLLSGSKLLLLLGSKLLLLLGSKLLLLSRSKLLLLLLLLGSESLRLLLLLLEVVKVLVERVLVELAAEGLLGVEVGRVEHRSPLSPVLVGEGLPLHGQVLLLLDTLLLLHHALLVGEHGLVSGLLPGKGGVLNDLCDDLFGELVVGGEASAVVAAVLHGDDLTSFVQETVHAFHVALDVPGLHLEGSVRRLVADCVASILVDFVDLFDNDVRVLGGRRCIC